MNRESRPPLGTSTEVVKSFSPCVFNALDSSTNSVTSVESVKPKDLMSCKNEKKEGVPTSGDQGCLIGDNRIYDDGRVFFSDRFRDGDWVLQLD
jgi:hypothetical protein